jgi:hypothetical protein
MSKSKIFIYCCSNNITFNGSSNTNGSSNINGSCKKVVMEVPMGHILSGLMELVISSMINEEMLVRRVSMGTTTSQTWYF